MGFDGVGDETTATTSLEERKGVVRGRLLDAGGVLHRIGSAQAPTSTDVGVVKSGLVVRSRSV